MFDEEGLGGGFAETFDTRADSSNSTSPQRGARIDADVKKGIVKSLQPYGAFVSLPDLGKEGLLHISKISDQRVENVADVLNVGQSVWVKVSTVEGGKLSLCMKNVNQEDGSAKDSSSSYKNSHSTYRGIGGGVRLPEVKSVHQATVRRIQPFGAFMSIEGFDRDGLLHISCLSAHRVERVEEVLSVGDRVWVKVTEVDEDGKYRLDMRGISQSTGEDTDPNDLTRIKGPRHKAANREDPIIFEAVYNTTCTRCGGKGHMSYECYTATGHRYDLLEEEDSKNSNRSLTEATAIATGANTIQIQKSIVMPLEQEGESGKGKKKHRTKKRHRATNRSCDEKESYSDSLSRKRKKKRKREEASKSKKRRRS